jgi:hypothetical protein
MHDLMLGCAHVLASPVPYNQNDFAQQHKDLKVAFATQDLRIKKYLPYYDCGLARACLELTRLDAVQSHEDMFRDALKIHDACDAIAFIKRPTVEQAVYDDDLDFAVFPATPDSDFTVVFWQGSFEDYCKQWNEVSKSEPKEQKSTPIQKMLSNTILMMPPFFNSSNMKEGGDFEYWVARESNTMGALIMSLDKQNLSHNVPSVVPCKMQQMSFPILQRGEVIMRDHIRVHWTPHCIHKGSPFQKTIPGDCGSVLVQKVSGGKYFPVGIHRVHTEEESNGQPLHAFHAVPLMGILMRVMEKHLQLYTRNLQDETTRKKIQISFFHKQQCIP